MVPKQCAAGIIAAVGPPQVLVLPTVAVAVPAARGVTVVIGATGGGCSSVGVVGGAGVAPMEQVAVLGDQQVQVVVAGALAPAARRVKVYFTIGSRQEEALFWTNTPPDQIKDLFRAAAEASPRDILKLYNRAGQLLNINAGLEPNTPLTRYAVQVVAAHSCVMLEERAAVQLQTLEARISNIERLLKADTPLPDAVRQLQRQVDAFREKLETTESLCWLGFNKQLPMPVSTEECRRLKYRRKSDSIKKQVKMNFANICDSQVSELVREDLRMPSFDTTQWEDEELLWLLQQMYLDFDLCSKFAIDIDTLRNFLYEAYKNYNEVPFHNFRHCFCVAQMMYAICSCVDLPSKIGDLEVLILLTSAICHDLDHPGYNNIYQINAKTELALRYNDISPLENHHCSVAFRILENEDCNLFKSFTSDTFKTIREGMIRSILATDMARHNEILTQFKETIPCFDYDNKHHVNLLCMVLIKVSDISNEARPMDVAEPWLDKLLMEFFKQSDAEKLEGLPVTPFMDRDRITKPSSQCSFIGFVLLPLFETLAELLTELQELIVQPVRDALDYYKRLNDATKEERLQRKSIVAELACGGDLSPAQSTGSGLTKSASNLRLKKSLSFQTNRSRSRSTDTDDTNTMPNSTNPDDYSPTSLAPPTDDLDDVAEGENESSADESETVTEVEASERALKFKISTEGNVSTNTSSSFSGSSSLGGRKSYPGSRKGSRERVVTTSLGGELTPRILAAAQRAGKLGKTMGTLSFDQHHHELYDRRGSASVAGKQQHLHLQQQHPHKNVALGQVELLEQIKQRFDSTGAGASCCGDKVNKEVTVCQARGDGDIGGKEGVAKENNVPPRPSSSSSPKHPAPPITTSSTAPPMPHIPTTPSKRGFLMKAIKRQPSVTTANSANSSPFRKSSDVNSIHVVDNNIAVDVSTGSVSPQQPQDSKNGRMGLFTRFKHFTDRLGLSLDRESQQQRDEHSDGGGGSVKGNKTATLKNNNSTRMTLPLIRRKNRDSNSTCCKSMDDMDDRRASTLPKTRKLGFGKRQWKLLLLGRDGKRSSLNATAGANDANLEKTPGGWSSDCDVAAVKSGGDDDVSQKSIPSTSQSQTDERCPFKGSPKGILRGNKGGGSEPGKNTFDVCCRRPKSPITAAPTVAVNRVNALTADAM